jgi:hypothetical protein
LPERFKHRKSRLVGQQVFGIALGYEDVLDYNELRHCPVRRCSPVTRHILVGVQYGWQACTEVRTAV